MKKLFFVLAAMMCSMSINAQLIKVMKGEEVVMTYTPDKADKVMIIEAKSPEGSIGTEKANIGGTQVDVPWVQLWAGGPKFAAYNVGVTDGNAESCGKFYAYGETEETSTHSWSDYKYTKGVSFSGWIPGDNQFTKYNSTDNKKVLDAEDDAATANWGNNWRMPVKADYQALIDNCDVENTTVNNIKGFIVRGKGDYILNYIFLPTYSIWTGGKPTNTENGLYGTATLGSSNCAGSVNISMQINWQTQKPFIFFDSEKVRYGGMLVRAVIKE